RVVLVVAAPPDTRLVAAFGSAVEPLVHAPEAVHSARVGGIRVVDGAVLERECAHAGPLARVRALVGAGHGREARHIVALGARLPRRLTLVVVFDAAFTLLLFGEPDVELAVELGAVRGRPGERPAHPLLVRLKRRERR